MDIEQDFRNPPISDMDKTLLVQSVEFRSGFVKFWLELRPMSKTTDHLRALDKQHIWHPCTHMRQWIAGDPLVITAAEGMHILDSDGNRYLDGVSSLWCNVHGHRVPEIDAAIRAQ